MYFGRVCSVVEIEVIEKGMLNVVGVGTNTYKGQGRQYFGTGDVVCKEPPINGDCD